MIRLILACVLLPISVQANFKQFLPEWVTHGLLAVDPHENYVRDGLLTTDAFKWTTEHQEILNSVDNDLVIQPSFMRSFILMADKQLLPEHNKSHAVRSLDEYMFREAQLSKSQIAFVRKLVKGTLYFNGPVQEIAPELYMSATWPSFSEDLNAFNTVRKGQGRPTVQLIVADRGVGTTSVVEKYATMRNRPVYRWMPSYSDEINISLVELVKTGRRLRNKLILEIQNLERQSPENIELISTLVRYPELLGDGSIVLIINPQEILGYKTNYQLGDIEKIDILKNILPHVDSVHFLRKPGTPLAMRRLINRLIDKDISRRISLKHIPIETKAPEDIVDALVIGALSMQRNTGHSMMRNLESIIVGHQDLTCAPLLSPSNRDLHERAADIRMTRAAQRYQEFVKSASITN